MYALKTNQNSGHFHTFDLPFHNHSGGGPNIFEQSLPVTSGPAFPTENNTLLVFGTNGFYSFIAPKFMSRVIELKIDVVDNSS